MLFRSNVEDLFHAADMSASGVISFEEFRTLHHLIHHDDDPNLKKTFDEYADQQASGKRGLDISAFGRLCKE